MNKKNWVAGFSVIPAIIAFGFRKNVFEIPPCTHHVIFITEFVLLIKTPLFYEVNSFL
jgi:hypothetical protein